MNDQKDSSIGHSTSTFNTYDEVVSRPFISLDMLHLNRGANANTHPSHNAKLESECDSSSHSDADLEKHDTDFISPSKFRELVKTPQDLYDNKCLIKPHNYKLAYTKLLTTLRKKFLEGAEIDKSASVKDEHSTQKHNLRYDLEVIIRSILERYAPIFISLTSNMIEEDLLLQEVTLQKGFIRFGEHGKISKLHTDVHLEKIRRDLFCQ